MKHPFRLSALRFRLWTLLIFVALIAACLSWYVVKRRAAERQAEVVALVEELGGSINYDFQSEYDPQNDVNGIKRGDGMHGPLMMSFTSPPLPGTESWLDRKVGVNFFSEVPYAYIPCQIGLSNLSDPDISEKYVRAIQSVYYLKGLRSLASSSMVPLTGKSLQNLHLVHNLDALFLGVKLDEEAFQVIGKIPSLRVFSIDGNEINDQKLAWICQKKTGNCSISRQRRKSPTKA